MPDKDPETDRLARLSTDADPGPHVLAELSKAIRQLNAGGADPYLLIGILLEGTVHTLASGIPEARRFAAALAIRTALEEMIEARGIDLRS